jgi:hypothetical protein
MTKNKRLDQYKNNLDKPNWGRSQGEHEPNAITRALVTAAKVCGHTHLQISQRLGICQATLMKYYPYELQYGVENCNTQIAATLFQKAIKGDTACLIFWAKTRMGWKETQVQEFVLPTLNLIEESSSDFND